MSLAELSLTDATAIYAGGLVVLAGVVGFLFKSGQADSRAALKEAHERESRTAAERDKAMGALIELAKSSVLVAERLDAIEQALRMRRPPRADRERA